MPKVPTLRGKVVATLFFEESTRTRLSFETAAKRLSADVLSLAVASSSVKKGESLRDTVETVEAMGIDAVIIRHSSAGAPHQVARWVERARVVNAGDGWHEHPTQALLDCFTVRQVLAERKGAAPEELGVACFEGLRVLIVGDIRHSRVARSEVLAYTALGAHVTLAAPGSLLPPSLEGWPVEVAADLDDGARRRRRGLAAAPPGRAGERVVRPQPARVHGRLGAHGAPGRAPGRRRHRHAPRARWSAGVEIASDVADLPRTVVTQQVANGVAVRMAILFLLLGGELPGRRRRCRPLPDADPRRSGAARSSDPTACAAPTSPSPDGTVVGAGRVHRRAAPAPPVLDAGGLPGRPRPGRPAHPPAPARPRGGRDDRDRRPGRRARRLHRRRGHAQHRAADRLGRGGRARCSTSAPAALAEVAVAGAITVGRAGDGPGPDGRAGRPRRDALHRRRRRRAGRRRSCAAPSTTPRASASRWPSTARTPAWPPAAPCTRGAGRAGSASRACRPRPRRSWWPATSPWSG